MQSFNLKSAIKGKIVFRLALMLLIGVVLPEFHAGAQQLTIQQIDKITIKENTGGLGGGSSSAYSITRNHTGWESTRTNKSSTAISHKTGKWENIDSAQVKFVAAISYVSINKLVYAINHPVRHFSPDILGITTEFLKTHADSLFKIVCYNPTEQQTNIFKQAITIERINQAIISNQKSDPMDVFEKYEIAIIKKTGDTIKIASANLRAYKLPWTVTQKGEFYNIGISRFCADAINAKAGWSLNGGYICQEICSDIYNKYCKEGITSAYFRKTFANAFQQLETCYRVSNISTGDILQAADPIVFMKLRSAAMPENVNVNTALRIKHNNDVVRLVNTKGKFDSLLKHKNFLFDFILHSPGYRLTIEDPNDSLSQYNWHQSNYPYLRSSPQANVMEFRIQNKANDDEYSQWALLPNGQIALLWLSGQKVLNFTRQQLNLDQLPPYLVETCVIFDDNGKILYNFTR